MYIYMYVYIYILFAVAGNVFALKIHFQLWPIALNLSRKIYPIGNPFSEAGVITLSVLKNAF